MRFQRLAVLAFALGLLAFCQSHAHADDVTTSAGKKISGKLVGVDAQGITFVVGESKVQIPASDIVVVDFANKNPAPPVGPYSEIALTDGSTIRVSKYLLKGTKFEFEQLPVPKDASAPTFEVPMGSVFTAMKKADEQKTRDGWKKLLATRGKRDMYVMAQETGFTSIQGTITSGSADGKSIAFEKEFGGKDELQQSRSAGFVFAQPQPANIPPTLCKVTDAFGNSFIAASITFATDSVTVTTVSGASVKYASVASLSKLDYALGNIAYLSDLTPQVETPEVPAEEKKLNPLQPFLKDRSLANEQLKLDSVAYNKGLCVAPDVALTFNLANGEYTQFKAIVGIDENGANATSSARVIIEADGQVLFSETIKRKDKAKGVVLAVKGVKQLRVIVEADTPLNGNYVTLAEARVQK